METRHPTSAAPNAPAGPTLRTPSYSVPLSIPTPAANPSRKWDCVVCQRRLFEGDQIAHLAGKAHRKRQVVWDATERKRVLANAVAPGMAPRAPASAPGSSGARVGAAPPLWECTVCERSMTSAQKEIHLSGRPHAMEQAKLGAGRQNENMLEKEEKNNEERRGKLRMAQDKWIEEGRRKKEEEDELRRTELLRFAAQKPENEMKLKEMRRASQIWIEEETKKKEGREMVERQELGMAEKIRVEEENRKLQEQEGEILRNAQEILIQQIQIERIRVEEEKGNEEKRLENLRRTEEESRSSREEEEESLTKEQEVQLQLARNEVAKQRTVEEIRVEEECHSNAVREAKLDLQNAAAAEGQLRIEQVQQREMWMNNEEQAAAAAWKMEEQLRMEQDGRRKERMRKQEEEASIAWQKEEQLRIAEENRRMEWIRKQEEQEAAAWRMVEQIRIEEHDRRKEWMRKQDQQAVENWRMEERFRIEDEIQKKEWMVKQEEAVAVSRGAGEFLRLEQEKCRKDSQRKLEEAAAELTRAELLRKQSGEEALQEQELQRTQTRLAQVQLEIQKKQEQQQAVDRVADEQQELVQLIGGQSSVVDNHPSTGSSIDTMGWFQPGIPSIQNSHQRTAQEIPQQVWMPPHVIMTCPLPIRSVANIPPILYRVYDETSVSKYSWEGFTAAASCMPQDAYHFRGMVNLHGNWSSRESTPFISVTDSQISAAWHIQIKQARRNQSNIMVALIDTAALLGLTSVWKMHDARDHFGLQPWKCHRRAFDHEYICALRIPARAIIACCRPGYFKQNARMFLDGLGTSDGTDTCGERAL